MSWRSAGIIRICFSRCNPFGYKYQPCDFIDDRNSSPLHLRTASKSGKEINDSGPSDRRAAAVFNIARATVKKWLKSNDVQDCPFVAIARATRWVFMHIYGDMMDRSSVDFLRRLGLASPIKTTQILIDNGPQFIDRFTTKNKTPSGKHVFYMACACRAPPGTATAPAIKRHDRASIEPSTNCCRKPASTAGWIWRLLY